VAEAVLALVLVVFVLAQLVLALLNGVAVVVVLHWAALS
jgi:hypothetical protein